MEWQVTMACSVLCVLMGAAASVVAQQAPASERHISGVRPLQFKIGNQCTFVGAMQAGLQAMDDTISYNELMGTSGAAFRLCFAQPQWDFSSVDGMLSYDHASVALRALGYTQASVTSGADPGKPGSQEIRGQIVASIDAGRPALAIDLVGPPEWAVIAGYEQGGQVLLCRSYFDDFPGTQRGVDQLVRSTRWPWVRVIFGPKGQPMAQRDALLQSIKVAVTFAKKDEYFTSCAGGNYARGLTAYRAWAEDLRDEQRFATPADAAHDCQVNSFCFDALLDARIAAAEYLDKRISLLEGDDRDHLKRAAEGYRSIADQLRTRGGECVLRPAEDGSAPGWTQEMRDNQAALLEQCATLEENALAELAAILHAH